VTLLETGLPHRPSPLRMRLVPPAMTILGSGMTLLPIVANWPLLPPFGLLVALGWRLLRPEMWPAWVAFPLGLVDDLLTGAPLGSAATLWTAAFLFIDIVDGRPLWRDHLMDWWIAAGAILFCGLGGWAIDRFVAGGGRITTALPAIAFAILLFPPIARLCALVDRWRLSR
jgi:rod shape-determining protein MreD